jgi:hypothetical protein
VGEFKVSHKPFEPSDGHRFTFFGEDAVTFALDFLRAYPAANGGEIILLFQLFCGFIEFPVGYVRCLRCGKKFAPILEVLEMAPRQGHALELERVWVKALELLWVCWLDLALVNQKKSQGS